MDAMSFFVGSAIDTSTSEHRLVPARTEKIGGSTVPVTSACFRTAPGEEPLWMAQPSGGVWFELECVYTVGSASICHLH